MAHYPHSSSPDAAALSSDLTIDTQTWDSLKRAISASSGFQRWLLERSFEQPAQESGLNLLVHSYLRETLETLAY